MSAHASNFGRWVTAALVAVLCASSVAVIDAAPALKITPPVGTLNLGFLPSVEVTVSNMGDTPIRALRIGRATLQGRDGTVDGRFLCLTSSNKCDTGGVEVPLGGKAVPLYVITQPAQGVEVPYGQFTGTVWLIDGDGNEYDFPLKLAVTSTASVAVGIAMLITGATLSWFLTRYLRGRSQRNEAEVPALELSETLTSLQTVLTDVGQTTAAKFPNLDNRLRDLLGMLATAELDHHQYLPPKIPSPWSSSRATQYAAFLARSSAAAGALTVIVKSGIQVAAARWPHATPAEETAITAALNECDLGAIAVDTVPAAQTVVVQALARLRVASSGGGVVAKGLPSQAAEPTFTSLRVEQTAIAAAFWAIWLIVTVAAGYATLILFNPGFGETGDWFKCALWGLGFHLVGGQVQNLTSASASTVLNVSIPKAM